MQPPQQFESLDQVRAFVSETLCRHEHLEPVAFPLTEGVMLRGGKPCGIQFCLHGPRAVKCFAIWSAETNVVHFYNSAGKRFLTTHLSANSSGLKVA